MRIARSEEHESDRTIKAWICQVTKATARMVAPAASFVGEGATRLASEDRLRANGRAVDCSSRLFSGPTGVGPRAGTVRSAQCCAARRQRDV
jgi:hypothetical protein